MKSKKKSFPKVGIIAGFVILYSFEVLAMKKNSSLSLAPGSGNGYVKLLISKK